MAFDAFLEIAGIPGESQDSKHKNWVEILRYEHNVFQPISDSASSGGSLSSERVNHGSFKVLKTLDKSTPKLAVAICTGAHIPKVTLELCRATGDKQKYMEYELEDVLVKSVQPVGEAKGDGLLPKELVEFVYGKITWTYTELDQKSGTPKGDISGYWSVTENTGG